MASAPSPRSSACSSSALGLQGVAVLTILKDRQRGQIRRRMNDDDGQAFLVLVVDGPDDARQFRQDRVRRGGLGPGQQRLFGQVQSRQSSSLADLSVRLCWLRLALFRWVK